MRAERRRRTEIALRVEVGRTEREWASREFARPFALEGVCLGGDGLIEAFDFGRLKNSEAKQRLSAGVVWIH